LFSKNESKKNENSKTDDDSEKMSIEKFVDLKLKNMKVTNFLLEPKNILKVLNDLGDYLIQLMVYLKKKSESKKFQIFDNISKKLITPSNKINFVFLQHFFKNESILVLKKLCLFFLFFDLKKNRLFYENLNIKFNVENFDNLFFNDLRRVSILIKEKIKEINGKNILYLNNENSNSISKIKKLESQRYFRNLKKSIDESYKAPRVLDKEFFSRFQKSENLFNDSNKHLYRYNYILDYNQKLRKFVNESFSEINRKNIFFFNK
jgi:hypothetical protein